MESNIEDGTYISAGHSTGFTSATTLCTSSIVFSGNGESVLMFKADGEVWLKGRKIEGDDEFKQAMIWFYKYTNGLIR